MALENVNIDSNNTVSWEDQCKNTERSFYDMKDEKNKWKDKYYKLTEKVLELESEILKLKTTL